MTIQLVQKFRAEVDSIDLLEQYLRLAISTALKPEEVAVKIVSTREPNYRLSLPGSFDEKKQFPVIQIGGWYLPKGGKENSYFNGYEPWQTFRADGSQSAIDQALEMVRGVLLVTQKHTSNEFLEKFGSGYTSFFNEYDGHTGIGYTIDTCGCFPERLMVGLTHIYYGK